MSNPNVTFHLEVEKVQLKELLNGYDNFEIRIDSSTAKVTEGKFIKQFSPPGYYEILLSRKMDSSEARKLKLSHMPGFNVTVISGLISVVKENGRRISSVWTTSRASLRQPSSADQIT